MGTKMEKPSSPQMYFEQSKVLLVWVKLHAVPCSHLSSNVLREVCTYLSCRQPLFALLSSAVHLFDDRTHSFALLWPLSKPLPLSELSVFAQSGPDKLFVFEGLDENLATSRAVFSIDAGVVTPLPEMISPRAAQGVLFDHVRNTLYVFGGLCFTKTLQSAEVFETSQWASLPDMMSARAFFNPCSYHTLIFLCGGRTTSVETYDPASREYRRLDELVLPPAAHISDCTSVVSDGDLVLVACDFMLTYDFRKKRAHKQFTPGRFHVWSNCPPVLFRGVVHFAGFSSRMKPLYRTLDLARAAWLDEAVFRP